KLNKMMIEPAAPKELAVALDDRYIEISDLPRKNSRAVKIAPQRTSRKRTLASGRKAKTQPNKMVITRKDTHVLMRLIICRLMSGIYSPKKYPNFPINNPMTLLRMREAMSKKPSPKIIEKESKRSMMILSQPFLAFTLICQISLMDF